MLLFFLLASLKLLALSRVLETVGKLNGAQVAESEFLRTVERIALPKAADIEGIGCFDQQVFHGDIACAYSHALHAVKIAIGQEGRAVAAEEGAVLECLVVGESRP